MMPQKKLHAGTFNPSNASTLVDHFLIWTGLCLEQLSFAATPSQYVKSKIKFSNRDSQDTINVINKALNKIYMTSLRFYISQLEMVNF